MHHRVHWSLPLFDFRSAAMVVIVATGCAERPLPATHTVRDSAGIQIVENEDIGRWPAGQEWHLDFTPFLDIGADDTDSAQILQNIIHARRLRDGRIAVVSYRTDDVRIFDAGGRHTQTVGRAGQGPGEFSEPWWISETAGDSLLVLDIGPGFVFNLFTPEGDFVRRYGTEVSRGVEGTQMVGDFADGTLLVLRFGDVPATEPDERGIRRSLTSFFRVNTNGELIDSLGLFPNQSSTSAPNLRLMWGPWGQGDGGRGGFYFGAGDTFEIEFRGLDGRLLRLIRLNRPARQMTDADVARFRESRLENARKSGDPGALSTIRALDERATFAAQLPLHFYVRADADNNVWVQEYAVNIATGRRWSVFDTAGVFLGDVDMPERFRVFEIGTDYVLGNWRDDLDVEHVRMYRLRKPR